MLNWACINSATCSPRRPNPTCLPLPVELYGTSLDLISVGLNGKDALKFAMNGGIVISVRKIKSIDISCVTTVSTKFLALCFYDEVLG